MNFVVSAWSADLDPAWCGQLGELRLWRCLEIAQASGRFHRHRLVGNRGRFRVWHFEGLIDDLAFFDLALHADLEHHPRGLGQAAGDGGIETGTVEILYQRGRQTGNRELEGHSAETDSFGINKCGHGRRTPNIDFSRHARLEHLWRFIDNYREGVDGQQLHQRYGERDFDVHSLLPGPARGALSRGRGRHQHERRNDHDDAFHRGILPRTPVMGGGVVHSPAMSRVAYIVSPHGFGHAARACAVMAELCRQRPTIHFEVFSEVPQWFFSESLPHGFSYHRFTSDVGMVQRSPLVEDLEATCDLLDRNRCDDPDTVGRLAARLQELGCDVVIVDISPLGLAAAAAAGIPSVLVENFTWDWIYLNYPNGTPRLRRHGRRMVEIFASANLRIQTDPMCEPSATAVRVGPVARSPRSGRETIRASLEVPADEPMIVVSMGGVPWNYGDFADFDHSDGAWVVVPGGSERVAHRRGRFIMLPFHSDFYHPDLVASSDLVVSKLGYSTVAEAYRAGTALAYVGRPHFPESPILAQWVEEHMVAAEIREDALRDGAWLASANKLLEIPRRKPDQPNGAVRTAEVILERFGSMIG